MTSPVARLVAVLVLFVASSAWAADGAPALPSSEPVPTRVESVLAAPLVEAPPLIDGKLDDAAWARAQPLRHFSFKKAGVNFQTEGWICRDARNFYIAARCFDDRVDKLVTKNDALWRNDCLEIYLVPNKDAKLYMHFVVDADGKYEAPTWVPDEWGEPTAGPKVALDIKTGREAKAWTAEIGIPIEPLGVPIKPSSVWAFGLNREKWTEPVEISSFQGGFNRPAEYPDLVFDGRTIVVDGLGVKSIGPNAQAVRVRVAAEGQPADKDREIKIDLPKDKVGPLSGTLKIKIPGVGGSDKGEKVKLAPGESQKIDWKAQLGQLKEGQSFTIDVLKDDGSVLAHEKYVLVAPPKALIELDTSKLPQPKFAPSPLDDPSFFPIGVWLQPAGKAAEYKKMGVNVFYGGERSYPNPAGKTWLDAIQKEGAYGIISYSEQNVAEKLQEHPAMMGWHVDDEPDQSREGVPAVSYDAIAVLLAKVRAAAPAKPLFMNLSCGVADERWIGRGLRDADYPRYCSLADVISYDIYPCNSLGADGPERFHMVAKGMDRLRKWTDGRKPLWFILEINRFTRNAETDTRSPTPDEVKSQMWMAIVHGARGLTFFCHSWFGESTYSRIEPDMREGLTKYTAEIHSLATVLNSPTLTDAVKVEPTMGGRVDTLVKKLDGTTYVFAVNMYRKAEKPTISVAGAADGQAEVLFENRTVEVKGGKIVDDFAPYAVHRYKIGR